MPTPRSPLRPAPFDPPTTNPSTISQPLPQGTIRVNVKVNGRHGPQDAWRHLHCFLDELSVEPSPNKCKCAITKRDVPAGGYKLAVTKKQGARPAYCRLDAAGIMLGAVLPHLGPDPAAAIRGFDTMPSECQQVCACLRWIRSAPSIC